MANRVLVDGPLVALEAVRNALPGMIVDPLATAHVRDPAGSACLVGVECVFIDQTQEPQPEQRSEFLGRVPVVVLLNELLPAPVSPLPIGSQLPRASSKSAAEIRLALHAAVAGFQAQRFFNELTGPWMHDARGALGVAQLALKLMETDGDSSSPVQKLESALMRLGWLVERLPTQYALCLDLPEANHSSPSVFPSLLAYVQHLRRVQPRRAIDFSDGTSGVNPSDQLVPYAFGLAEFAFKLSRARARLAISVIGPQAIEVESECPERPPPFDACSTMSASDVEAFGSAVPYRLLEVTRLARATGALLNLEFSSHGFKARVDLPSHALT